MRNKMFGHKRKIFILLLLIAIVIMSAFWGLGYRGFPIARNVQTFVSHMTKEYEGIYEITEQKDNSVTLEIKYSEAEQNDENGHLLYNTLVRNNGANMNIEFKTGGSFSWPVSLKTLEDAGWEHGNGHFINCKKQYIDTLGYKNDKFVSLIVKTDKVKNDKWLPLAPEKEAKYYKAPKFVACGKITNNSNFNDIFELGFPAMITFYEDDHPHIDMTYLIFEEGETKPYGTVSFTMDALKNKLLGVTYFSWL